VQSVNSQRTKSVIANEEKCPEMPQNYDPPKWAWSLLMVLVDPDIRQTDTAICVAIGIDRKTYWRHKCDPLFVAWLDQKMTQVAAQKSGRVLAALIRECETGNMQAIEFYADRIGLPGM